MLSINSPLLKSVIRVDLHMREIERIDVNDALTVIIFATAPRCCHANDVVTAVTCSIWIMWGITGYVTAFSFGKDNT